MERAVNYAMLVDGTNFGTVRRYLRNAKTPDTGVLFVASPELLGETARLLEASETGESGLRQHQAAWLFRSGQLRLGGDQAAEREGIAVDLDRVDDEAYCQVIYLPPVYLVHVPGLVLRQLPKQTRAW